MVEEKATRKIPEKSWEVDVEIKAVLMEQLTKDLSSRYGTNAEPMAQKLEADVFRKSTKSEDYYHFMNELLLKNGDFGQASLERQKVVSFAARTEPMVAILTRIKDRLTKSENVDKVDQSAWRHLESTFKLREDHLEMVLNSSMSTDHTPVVTIIESCAKIEREIFERSQSRAKYSEALFAEIYKMGSRSWEERKRNSTEAKTTQSVLQTDKIDFQRADDLTEESLKQIEVVDDKQELTPTKIQEPTEIENLDNILQEKVAKLEGRVENLEQPLPILELIKGSLKGLNFKDEKVQSSILYFSWILGLFYLPYFLYPLFLSIMIFASMIFCLKNYEAISTALDVIKPCIEAICQKLRNHPELTNASLCTLIVLLLIGITALTKSPLLFGIFSSVPMLIAMFYM